MNKSTIMKTYNILDKMQVHQDARLLHIPSSGSALRAWRIFKARFRPRAPVLNASSCGASTSESSPSSSAVKSSAPGSIDRVRSRSAYAALRRAAEDVDARSDVCETNGTGLSEVAGG